MNTASFYIFLFIHIVSLVVGFGAVFVIDTFGLLWLLKKVSITRVTSVAQVTQVLIWIGWFGLVFSGIGLLVHKDAIDNLTIIKLFFVALLGLNGVYLHIAKRGFEKVRDGDTVQLLDRFRIGLASTISQLGWWSALTIGFLHRQWHHEINWPPHPIVIMLGLYAVCIIALVTGETMFKNK